MNDANIWDNVIINYKVYGYIFYVSDGGRCCLTGGVHEEDDSWGKRRGARGENTLPPPSSVGRPPLIGDRLVMCILTRATYWKNIVVTSP